MILFYQFIIFTLASYMYMFGTADNVNGLGAEFCRDYLCGLRLVLRPAEAEIVYLSGVFCI